MRPSQRKTTVATLRLFLDAARRERDGSGMSQKELADLLGKAPSSVQSLETGRLKMSHETATIIARETGVDFNWLVSAKPNAPLLDKHGKAYSLESYERTRVLRESEERRGEPSKETIQDLAREIKTTQDLLEVFSDLLPKHPDAELWAYRMKVAIFKVAGDFNFDLMKRNPQREPKP